MASLKTTILFVFRKKSLQSQISEQFLFDAFNSFNSR